MTNVMSKLTTEEQNLINGSTINVEFTDEQMNDKEFTKMWCEYVLHILYGCMISSLPSELVEETQERIFSK